MPNLQHQNLRREKNTKFTTKFTWGKNNTKFTTSKFPWEIVRNICQIYNINIYMRKNAKFTTSKFAWGKQKRQIYNIKICVRKKTAKFTTSKFTWEKNAKFTTSKFTWGKKTPKLKHQKLRGKKREIHNITCNIEDNIGRVPKHR